MTTTGRFVLAAMITALAVFLVPGYAGPVGADGAQGAAPSPSPTVPPPPTPAPTVAPGAMPSSGGGTISVGPVSNPSCS